MSSEQISIHKWFVCCDKNGGVAVRTDPPFACENIVFLVGNKVHQVHRKVSHTEQKPVDNDHWDNEGCWSNVEYAESHRDNKEVNIK